MFHPPSGARPGGVNTDPVTTVGDPSTPDVDRYVMRCDSPPSFPIRMSAVENLDEATSDKVLEQFLELVRGEGSAALVATHNERLAARMDRVVRLHDGKLD